MLTIMQRGKGVNGQYSTNRPFSAAASRKAFPAFRSVFRQRTDFRERISGFLPGDMANMPYSILPHGRSRSLTTINIINFAG
ncbi:hypothetical protein [Paenibacillus abyssi]|uniref:hypothetical protein n=1 Tax=Paenibacillus abyssi TaxID=1340531 RepID=UPI0016657DDF|nr:hypothetical protein [Paenibacillus abyssi]